MPPTLIFSILYESAGAKVSLNSYYTYIQVYVYFSLKSLVDLIVKASVFAFSDIRIVLLFVRDNIFVSTLGTKRLS